MAKLKDKVDIGESSVWYDEWVSDQSTSLPKGQTADKEEKFKFIGQYTKRIDGDKIVTGQAHYTHDIKLRDMLTGKILRSPHAKAEILSVDLNRAKSLPGVKAALQVNQGKILYAGQQVAAVAAGDEKTAEKALEMIKVEYKTLPFVVTEEKAREEGAPKVHDDRPNVEERRGYSRGDVEAGFEQANVVIERTYKTAIEIHQTNETHVSIALWQGEKLTIWDSTQAIHSVRDQLASSLQIPAARIKV
ncbi:MAG: molybdopterin-dependent oxidoreductase, partial [Candidatus Aminicenantes bacterium]|nr:molybdopterin-dependent oxidoreductase [Candidatus Aminicenantes bacterium]